MLTIFANLRINDENRLQHFKDSFLSIQGISDNWLINIRGNFRNEALAFLKTRLGNQGTYFELLDDERGWMNNALEMLPHAKYEYVMIWLEDHINLAPLEIYKDIVSEMKAQNAHYLLYSWWIFGKAREAFDKAVPEEIEHHKSIDTMYVTKKTWKKILQNDFPYYLISICGIFDKQFLYQLLNLDKWMLPMSWTKNIYRLLIVLNTFGLNLNKKTFLNKINKTLFFNKLPRFPQETPFNIEKGPWRTDILPIKIAIPKQELFACIDDDLGTPGYMLIKRGKYPLQNTLEKKIINNDLILQKIEENDDYLLTKQSLQKGKSYRIMYFQNANRNNKILIRTVTVLKGKLLIELNDKSIELNNGEFITLYSNLPYLITSIENSEILEISPSLNNNQINFQS